MGAAKKVASVAAGAMLVIGGLSSAAIANGAGGGEFKCSITGIPNWGTVTSEYNHPTKTHWATATGKGRHTVEKAAGVNAVASVGRSTSGNACNWGTR